MNPHEETWGDDYEVTVVGPRLERNEDVAREVLARAAPDMARALLDLLGDGPRRHLSFCHALSRDGHACRAECTAVRSALEKAGVPLP